MALFTLFLGMYLEVLYQVDIFPLGLVPPEPDGLPVVRYDRVVMRLFSGTILYRAYQAETRSHSDGRVLGGILLGYLFISGFEFILYGDGSIV